MDGPTEPGIEFEPDVVGTAGRGRPRRARAFVALWVVGLSVVALLAFLGRGVVTVPVVVPTAPAVAEVSPSAPPTSAPPSVEPSPPARVEILLPHGPIATLIDDSLLVTGTIEGKIDSLRVTVRGADSRPIGSWTLIGPDLSAIGGFRARVQVHGVERTDWLFIEVAAANETGPQPEIVRRAVQVASLDPTA